MYGEIATLNQNNKQVGGLFNWTIVLTEEKHFRGGWSNNRPLKQFTAESYWLLETPKQDKFEVKFYQAIGNELYFVARESLVINFPSLELNRKIKNPVIC